MLYSFLVVHGADINAVDSEGMTPLDWAESTERPDVAESVQSLPCHALCSTLWPVRYRYPCLTSTTHNHLSVLLAVSGRFVGGVVQQATVCQRELASTGRGERGSKKGHFSNT